MLHQSFQNNNVINRILKKRLLIRDDIAVRANILDRKIPKDLSIVK